MVLLDRCCCSDPNIYLDETQSDWSVEVPKHASFLFCHEEPSAGHRNQVSPQGSRTNNSCAMWSVIGFIFNYLLRRRQFAWWSKYNCEILFRSSNFSDIMSAGLDSGLAISVLVIFLTLSLPKSGIDFNWWGNVGAFNTAVLPSLLFCSHCQDFNGLALLQVGANETFGPASW